MTRLEVAQESSTRALDTAFGGSSGPAYREFRDGVEVLIEGKRRNPAARAFSAGLTALRRRAEAIADRGKVAEMDARRIQEQQERQEAGQRSFSGH